MDYKRIAVINERKLKAKNEELKEEIFNLKQRIEEVEGQFAYECECNKEFVACQNENERLKEIVYNAIMELVGSNYEHNKILKCLNITNEEYVNMMKFWSEKYGR